MSKTVFLKKKNEKKKEKKIHFRVFAGHSVGSQVRRTAKTVRMLYPAQLQSIVKEMFIVLGEQQNPHQTAML